LVIEVINRQRRRVDRRAVVKAVETVLGQGGWSHAELTIAIVDGRTMRRLNREFLGHDYVTDVLSFEYARDARKKRLAGEVVVCADQAWNAAAKCVWSGLEELLLYVIHGTLHLMGYNDDSAAALRRMRAAERKGLRALGLGVVPGPLSSQVERDQ
jgi:probable rRNA maturation factor